MVTGFELRKFLAPEFIFGNGARLLAGRYARNFSARRVFIVTDPGVMASGWLNDVTHALKDGGLQYRVYSNVNPNPRVEDVMEGAKLYQEEECDVIIAVGGGSPMDCAKGIGIVSSNKKHITEFEGVDKVGLPAPPLICIPTTAGSSVDVSQFSIISDPIRCIKMGIISKTLVPDVALIDPVVTTTMPRDMTVYTAFDTLSHALESYVSNASSAVTDLHALEAVRLVTSNIIPVIADPEDINLRGNLMLASLHAGMAFSNASLGLAHAMAHSLGGLMDLSHGECNAILMEHVVEFNFQEEPERYTEIARAMGLEMNDQEVKSELIKGIKILKKGVGINKTLKDCGVSENDLDGLADVAMMDPCIVTNPRRPDKEEIMEIFKNAL
ncbi:Alcohol dehydrogenase 2 [anaerobic digester metagenome]